MRPLEWSRFKPRIESLVGCEVEFVGSPQGGYTPALRWICRGGGRTFFVKIAISEWTHEQLQMEYKHYSAIQASFLPEVLAFQEQETESILILEDLSRFHWPPPWSDERLALAVEGIHQIHATDISQIPESQLGSQIRFEGWAEVGADPTPLLSTGLMDAAWLEGALPVLIEASGGCLQTGDKLTHGDLRSDNMCMDGERVIFVDWNWARRWNPTLDLAFFLNSVRGEGGPRQESYLSSQPGAAAVVSGFFAFQAGLTGIPDAPRVRWIQKEQLKAALPWVCAELSLPEPSRSE